MTYNQPRRRGPFALASIALLGAIALSSQAHASTFGAGVAVGGSLPSCMILVASPESGTFSTNSSGSGSSAALAEAGADALGGSSVSTSTGAVSSTNTNASCFRVQAVIDDIIISGPGPSATIRVSADIGGLVEIAALNTTWG